MEIKDIIEIKFGKRGYFLKIVINLIDYRLFEKMKLLKLCNGIY